MRNPNHYMDQYKTNAERNRSANRYVWREARVYLFAFLLLPVFLFLMWWAIENGPEIDSVCNDFWR